MARSKILFLGGVPGAGKTTTSSQLVASGASVTAIAASSFVRTRAVKPTIERPLVADSQVLEANQNTIVAGFARFAQSVETEWIVLDGHFVVPARHASLEIDVSVFCALGVDVFAVLQGSAIEIRRRLLLRGGAEWWDGTLTALETLQIRELTHARKVAASTSRPLHVVDENERSLDYLTRVLQQS